MTTYEIDPCLDELLRSTGLTHEVDRTKDAITLFATQFKYGCNQNGAQKLIEEKKVSFGDHDDLTLVAETILHLAKFDPAMTAKLHDASTISEQPSGALAVAMAVYYLNTHLKIGNDTPDYIR
jgi:hypothetical protein